MGRYAQHTRVPVTRTRDEIERVLTRYGADSFVCGWSALAEEERIEFTYRGLRVQVSLKRPADDSCEQERRQRWRALLLVIKAKLEAVESDISTFEHEFLAWMVGRNGKTLGAMLVPRLEELARHGQAELNRLLPGPAT